MSSKKSFDWFEHLVVYSQANGFGTMCPSMRGKTFDREDYIPIRHSKAVIQVTLQCTAIMYWMTSKKCILYKKGELDSTHNNDVISGICPKGTNIENKWENKGFYCDKNGKTDLIGVNCLMIISILYIIYYFR